MKRRRYGRVFRIAYVALGIALLVLVLGKVDLDAVAAQVATVGIAGIAAVTAVYLFAFLVDSLTWQMALLQVPLDARWLYVAFRVRMVGEVFNTVLPAAGIGGEPLKAELLHRHYRIGYSGGIASLILARTINMIAQMAFLAVGFVVIAFSDLPPAFKLLAALGLAGFCVGTALLFYLQRLRVSSRTGRRFAARLGARAAAALTHVVAMDERLATFYSHHRGRFAAAVGLAFVNWAAGALEVWLTLWFIGQPVGFGDAWVIEAMTQLVRSGAFFVPGAIGVQEGILVLVCGLVTGQPALGLSVAIVRRVRELLWLIWGTLIGLFYMRRAPAPETPGESPAREKGA